MSMINDDEDDMKHGDLMKEVLKWAKKHGETFTSAMAFETIKDADDVKVVSDAVRKLYMDGQLARKKIDNVKFSYALIENAPQGYESVSDKSEQSIAVSVDAETPLETASLEIEKPIERAAPLKTAMPKPTIKEKENPPVALSAEMTGEIGSFQLPDSFTLTLKTPNGLVITIASGAVCN